MESLVISWNAVAPMFCVIFLGFFVRRRGMLSEDHIPPFNTVAFRFFTPCLIFYNICHSSVGSAFRPRLILFTLAALVLVFLLSFLLVCAVERRSERRGVMIQGMFRSNLILMGLPLAGALSPPGSDLGVIAIMAAIFVPLFNVLGVVVLEVFHGQGVDLPRILLGIVKNPLILGSALGLACLFSGVRLPHFLDLAAKSVTDMTTPFLLFLLGATFQLDTVRRDFRNVLLCVSARLLAIPGLCLGAAMALGFRGLDFISLICVFATPVSVSSFVMAEQMGGDGPLASSLVVYTSALSCVTLFFWTFLFHGLGVF